VHGEQVGAEHAHGDRVQGAQRMPGDDAPLARCGDTGRAALTLRYLDGLPVPDVARHLDRTVHATEALLVRARAAFRRIYEGEEGSR
jgi:hypothetical protein